MITPEMKAAGWRECPTDEVRKAWEAKGGRWQITPIKPVVLVGVAPLHLASGHIPMAGVVFAWRPVHPSTWNYCPQGWGSAVPTEPGSWWRKDKHSPVDVHEYDEGLGWFNQMGDASRIVPVTDDGQWIAPCVKPGVV